MDPTSQRHETPAFSLFYAASFPIKSTRSSVRFLLSDSSSRCLPLSVATFRFALDLSALWNKREKEGYGRFLAPVQSRSFGFSQPLCWGSTPPLYAFKCLFFLSASVSANCWIVKSL
ncbi:hypothetical protein J5N97_028070 [Dioscorea zingiberensis]|uniref:Uncharacterized protein n=1 Tax=Dioscorea zingiberensis TaxID=325984 RepID=A0A9D5BYB2_9LILI|nr:hypothetical protein J5N97_028070 [Dioscorea zingiberensis]